MDGPRAGRRIVGLGPPAQWTAGDVAGRLADCMKVLATRPNTELRWLRGAGGTMPDVVYSRWELQRGMPTRMRDALPEPSRVSDAEEALRWLLWIENPRRTVVMARSAGAKWREICNGVEITPPTAHKYFREGLEAIAARLNAGEE